MGFHSSKVFLSNKNKFKFFHILFYCSFISVVIVLVPVWTLTVKQSKDTWRGWRREDEHEMCGKSKACSRIMCLTRRTEDPCRSRDGGAETEEPRRTSHSWKISHFLFLFLCFIFSIHRVNENNIHDQSKVWTLNSCYFIDISL